MHFCVAGWQGVNEFGSCIQVHMYKVAIFSLMQYMTVVMKCVLFHIMKEHRDDFKSGDVTDLHGVNQRRT